MDHTIVPDQQGYGCTEKGTRIKQFTRDFSATRPNQKWNADTSNVWTAEGWLYLAVVLDLCAARGWLGGE